MMIIIIKIKGKKYYDEVKIQWIKLNMSKNQ